MADLNKQLIDIKHQIDKVKMDLTSLVSSYEQLHSEANRVYISQRRAKDNSGLEEFYRLLQIVRRNRNVVGSLLQGLSSIGSMDKFKFIEEDYVPVKRAYTRTKKKKEVQKQQIAPRPFPNLKRGTEPGEING